MNMIKIVTLLAVPWGAWGSTLTININNNGTATIISSDVTAWHNPGIPSLPAERFLVSRQVVTGISCGYGLNSTGCPPAQAGSTCATPEIAVTRFRRYVGLTYSWALDASTRPATFQFYCSSGGINGIIHEITGPVIFRGGVAPEPPVSCTSSETSLTLSGNVGERLTGTAGWDIRCDKRANLRLRMNDGGTVKTSGGGEVKLTFKDNGAATYDLATTSATILIDGVLTKSPTTAGTYQGAGVLVLDVL